MRKDVEFGQIWPNGALNSTVGRALPARSRNELPTHGPKAILLYLRNLKWWRNSSFYGRREIWKIERGYFIYLLSPNSAKVLSPIFYFCYKISNVETIAKLLNIYGSHIFCLHFRSIFKLLASSSVSGMWEWLYTETTMSICIHQKHATWKCS